MNNRRFPYTSEAAERVLGALRSGRSLRAVCRDDSGVPSLNTVLKWVKDDREGFAARYAEARSIGSAPLGRPALYSPEIADWILRGLSEGRRLSDICADAGMPSAATVRQWAIEDRADFAARYRQARDTGHAPTGRRTLYAAEIADIILAELGAGRTLNDVCRDPDMPAQSTVRLWVVEDREGFAARYATARQFGDEIMADHIVDIADDRSHDWIARPLTTGATEYILDTQRVRRARLRIMARRARLSKMMTRKHGAPPASSAGQNGFDPVKEVEERNRALAERAGSTAASRRG